MLRLLGALCFLILFLTACQSGTASEEEQDFPNFSEEQLHQMMLQQNPGAAALPQQKSLPEMIAQMEASLVQYPEDTSMYYNLAKLTYQQYQADREQQWLQKTLDYYGKVIALDADYEQGRPYYNRMLARMEQENYEGALQDLNAFVQINQGSIPVNHQAMQAKILFQQGKLEAACAVYQAAKLVEQQDSLPTGLDASWEERCP